MNSSLKAGSADPHPNLASLCSKLEQARAAGGLGEVGLDLRDLRRWEPTTLAVLLASISDLGDDHLEIPPVRAEGVTYLHPQILKGLMRDGISHWQEGAAGNGTMIGSAVFEDQESIYNMLQEVAGHLPLGLNLSPTWVASAHALGYELATNVIRHSGTRRGVGVVSVEPSRARLNLAIADTGVGIRASLAQNPKFATAEDLEAIIAAMGAAATGEPGKGAGMGLYLAHHVLQDNGGTFLVRSGTAYHELGEETEGYSNGLAHLQGTLVFADIRMDRSLDYGRVDRELREPQGISDRSNN